MKSILIILFVLLINKIFCSEEWILEDSFNIEDGRLIMVVTSAEEYIENEEGKDFRLIAIYYRRKSHDLIYKVIMGTEENKNIKLYEVYINYGRTTLGNMKPNGYYLIDGFKEQSVHMNNWIEINNKIFWYYRFQKGKKFQYIKSIKKKDEFYIVNPKIDDGKEVSFVVLKDCYGKLEIHGIFEMDE